MRSRQPRMGDENYSDEERLILTMNIPRSSDVDVDDCEEDEVELATTGTRNNTGNIEQCAEASPTASSSTTTITTISQDLDLATSTITTPSHHVHNVHNHKQSSRRQTEGSVTRLGLQLMMGTLAAFMMLSAGCQYFNITNVGHESMTWQSQHAHEARAARRQLEENDNNNNNNYGYNNDDNNNNNNDDNDEYEAYSCSDLYATTGYDDLDAQCQFAKQCNFGEGLVMSFVFCSQLNSEAYTLLLSPLWLTALITLFRMLGSTAEDYFSPALEMFSVKLGLPPRFAGVSLLALGNGAADVSATMNAITSDPHTGYLLALGALTGAGMFISTVVAGLVIVTANGVPCRGALVRDVVFFAFTVSVVYFQFSSGVIGDEAVLLFFGLYIGFVCIVLSADIYHRAVVLPRMEDLHRQKEVNRQHLEEQRVKAVSQSILQQQDSFEPTRTASGAGITVNTYGKIVPTALSPQNNGRTMLELKPLSTEAQGLTRTSLHLGRVKPEAEAAVVEAEAAGATATAEVAAAKASASGTTKISNPNKISKFGRVMEALSNYNEGNFNKDGVEYDYGNGSPSTPPGWGVDVEHDGIVVFHGRHTLKRMKHNVGEANTGAGAPPGSPTKKGAVAAAVDAELGSAAHDANVLAPGTEYQPMMDDYDGDGDGMPYNPCVDRLGAISGFDGLGSLSSHNWWSALTEAKDEFLHHWWEFFHGIYYNEDNSKLDKFVLTCEMPFTIARQVSQ
jgi:Ca2+/Na+ antiporter